MIQLVLNRKSYRDAQVVGGIDIYKDGEYALYLASLELPWLENKPNVSCIPKGEYQIDFFDSPSFGKCLKIREVNNRSYILIHKGNFNHNTKGCILVGITHSDINHDGYLDTVNSSIAFDKLISICENETEINIEIL